MLQPVSDRFGHRRHHRIRRMNNAGFGLGYGFTTSTSTDHIVDDLLFATEDEEVLVTDEGFGIRTLDHSDF